jgi:hypothetical protein
LSRQQLVAIEISKLVPDATFDNSALSEVDKDLDTFGGNFVTVGSRSKHGGREKYVWWIFSKTEIQDKEQEIQQQKEYFVTT